MTTEREVNYGPEDEVCSKCGNTGNRCHCHHTDVCEECRQEDYGCGAKDETDEGKSDYLKLFEAIVNHRRKAPRQNGGN